MSDGKGYLIPDAPSPDGERCILVFIPDDDFYLYAFMGAYRNFGKWIAWERDAEKRGKIAAERWQQSIECTEDFMSNCGVDLANAINNVADAILNKPCCESVTTVNVNTPVTVTIDPNDDGQPPTLPTTPTGDPATDPPPTGYPDWPTYYDDRCLAANWYADQVIDMVRKLENLGDVVLVVSVVVAAISLFFPPAFIAGMGTIALLGLAADIIALGLAGDFAFNHMTTIADDMETDKENLVCVFYNASSAFDMAQQAVDWFGAKLDLTAVALGWSTETTNKVKGIFDKYFGDYIVEWFESSFVDVVPDGYTGSVDCSMCGCPTYRALLSGTGDITGLGVKTIQSEQIDTNVHRIDVQLEENHCLHLDSTVASSFTVYKCENGSLVETTLTAESSYYKTVATRLYFEWHSPFTLDLDIVNAGNCISNPNWSKRYGTAHDGVFELAVQDFPSAEYIKIGGDDPNEHGFGAEGGHTVTGSPNNNSVYWVRLLELDFEIQEKVPIADNQEISLVIRDENGILQTVWSDIAANYAGNVLHTISITPNVKIINTDAPHSNDLRVEVTHPHPTETNVIQDFMIYRIATYTEPV